MECMSPPGSRARSAPAVAGLAGADAPHAGSRRVAAARRWCLLARMRAKRALVSLAGTCLLCVMPNGADAQATPGSVTPAKPKVYALIAAVGEELSLVYETPTTGTHLSPYRRNVTAIPHDILNRLALRSLDAAVAKVDPGSRRVYLAVPAAQVDGVPPSQREGVAIARIVHALEQVPQRRDWDRIVVAVPAYLSLARNGMASKLQGFGVFSEPLCQAGCARMRRADARYLDSEPPDGADAVTSEDKPIKTRTYIAPFSYIAVWVLDPVTLAVLDKQEAFDNQKLAEPVDKPPLDVDKSSTNAYVSARIASLIDSSVGEAVARSAVYERRADVRVGDVKDVTPPRGADQ
jgi:hypothetical protein